MDVESVKIDVESVKKKAIRDFSSQDIRPIRWRNVYLIPKPKYWSPRTAYGEARSYFY